jgi:thiosulfate/3-mercaptopyruvate sulfurtransferase
MTYQNPELLVEADELANLLADPKLRVLDATVFLLPATNGYRAESGLEKYRAGHVPGAAFMDLIQAFSDTTTGLGFSLPGPEQLAAALGSLGIGNDNPVVIYSTGHIMWATRAFWLLRYCGHDRVAVLNGGLKAWREAGHPISSGEESYSPTRFDPQPRQKMFVDAAGVQAAMSDGGTCTVNALSPEVFAGTGDHHYGRRGHIPGSLNLFYDQLMDGHRFRPAEALTRTLKNSGMLDAPRIITYCGGGISATVDAFACLLAGKDEVAVYDGSMSEWARDESLPLKTGKAP